MKGTRARLGIFVGFGLLLALLFQTAGSAVVIQAVSISISDASIAEGDAGAKNLAFTITMPNDRGTIDIDYHTSDGTAVAPGDYTESRGSLDVPCCATTATITVPIVGDTTVEPNETFSVTISSPNEEVTVSDGEGIGTIQNDDSASISINDPPNVSEGGTATFTVSMSAASSTNVTVNYSTASCGSNQASSGSDYTGVPSTQLTFSPGQTSKQFSVSTLQDSTDEPNETFCVNLSNPSGATIADGTGQATIVDDDAAPSISINDPTANEGSPANFNVTLSNPSSTNVTVNYTTTSCGTNQASAGSDYTSVASTQLTFSPGETTKSVSVTTLQDPTDEPNETFCVSLSNASNATISDSSGQGTILDDDPAPTLTIDDQNVNEGDTATFNVTLSAASAFTVSVNYATASGTATAGSDFTSVGTTPLTFSPGQTTKQVSVATLEDNADELNETFFVNLSSPSNASFGDNQGVGTIMDDDGAPTLSINDQSVNESAGTATFTVSLAGSTNQAVTVSAQTANGTATAGSDYTAVGPITLTFNPGETSKTLSVPITNDTIDEPNETFFVNLSNPSNATISDNQAQGTIVDNDEPPVQNTLSINDISVTEGNAGTTNAVFTVSVAGPARQGSISVGFATANDSAVAPADYSSTSGTLTIPANASSGTISVPVAGDTTVEPDEQFFVSLSSPNGATISDGQGVGTITNDDVSGGGGGGGPTVTLAVSDVSVLEGNSGTTSAVFTVTAGQHSAAISVGYATANGTAVAPGDYTATSGTLTIPGGATSGTISVPVVGDTVLEPDEQFSLNLSSASGATISDGQGIAMIRNDDEVTFIPTPQAQVESLPQREVAFLGGVLGNGAMSGKLVGRTTSSRAGVEATQQISCGLRGSDQILSACYATFRPDQQIQLTATPAAGYRFDGWSGGGCAGKARQCRVRLSESRSVSARFEPLGGAAAVAAELRQPRFRVIWARSIGNGNLLVGGSVSAPAKARVQLRRPGGGPLITKRLSLSGGLFRATIALRSGKLRGGALLLPGGFVISLTGTAQGVRLPLQLKTITLAAPAEGVVREAFASTSQGGAKLLRLPAGVTQAWANFRFATQPRPGPTIAVAWFRPDGTPLGTQELKNRPTIETGIGSPSAIPNGLWRVELRVGGRMIRQLAVRIGPG